MNKDTQKEDSESIRKAITLFKEHDVPYDKLIQQVDAVYNKGKHIIPHGIPISVFENEELSALEAIVKYLKEHNGMRLSEIARATGRDPRAIGVTYKFASKKLKVNLRITKSRYFFPVRILRDRKLSVLENIVEYIRKRYALNYHEIALLLKRDERTIWTVHSRAGQKRQVETPK